MEIKLAPGKTTQVKEVTFEKLKKNLEALGYHVMRHHESKNIHEVFDNRLRYVFSIHHDRIEIGTLFLNTIAYMNKCQMDEFYLNDQNELDFFTLQSPLNEIDIMFKRINRR